MMRHSTANVDHTLVSVCGEARIRPSSEWRRLAEVLQSSDAARQLVPLKSEPVVVIARRFLTGN